ncbi:MFS transporter [Brumicola blandensis]|uniref:MFS transporter n=1 Tax=Brumicola blandensis TaxID=3075611 RepID=A0AAW8R176_9ALTE|nr:MFS transporter [Alteromonas sp. W409]MDT0583036.1 MFS transporter [Alteromonas sp. W409]
MNTKQKPTLEFWQVWNMCFGFFGIQYGFGLQQANLSPIFSYHGAAEHELPILWLAGPVTGLLIQPLIGAISDRTWTSFGRRKPFFLWGALIGSVAVMFMPYVPELWMVVGLFWILDAAMNTAMEPYRAMVGDMVNREQRPFAFALQTFMISGGQILASLMPVVMIAFGVSAVTDGTQIPDIVKYSFVVGVIVIMTTAIWSFIKVKEYPPEDIVAFKAENKGKVLSNVLSDLWSAMRDMPKSLRTLWWVKLATWFGLPLMWQYLSLSIAHHVYNAPTPDAPGFAEGTAQGGTAFAVMHITTLVMSFFIAKTIHRLGDSKVYALCLLVGGIGFLSMQLTTDLYLTLACMALVGVGWAGVITVPFIMCANVAPMMRIGVYMGLLNAMICLPQILEMVSIGYIYESVLGGDPRNALALCGVLFIIGAGLALRINTVEDTKLSQSQDF